MANIKENFRFHIRFRLVWTLLKGWEIYWIQGRLHLVCMGLDLLCLFHIALYYRTTYGMTEN